MKKFSWLISSYFLVIFGLFFYSYTQVDLSLTLSRASIFQTIEKAFQYIGYFQRPSSTDIYLTLLGFLFLFYFIFLSKANRISRATFWKIIIAVSVILAFSYNGFSYDLFNYIFDAKIITHYHLNPYLYKALDFPKDPMLSFMHWTHRTYPYGPFWLVLTVPLSFIGFGFFLPTFFLFKLFTAGCFVGCVYFVEKILQKIDSKNVLFGTILFALNPLVIIESLVSAHNDIPMLFLGLIGTWLLLEKKWLRGIVFMVLSALTKQTGVFLLPVGLAYALQTIFKKKIVSERMFLFLLALSMVGGFIFILTRLEVQPWYILWFLPFLSFIKPNKILTALIVGISLGLLLRYAPFLYQGDWNGMVPVVEKYVTFVTPVVFVGVAVFWSVIRKIYAKP